MLKPRLIPCLLIENGGLVKTVKFSDSKYVGDPINAVRIFNEKNVDELMVLDIEASAKQRPPDFKLLAKLANECRMPLSYGGGVSDVDQINQIISLGIEKVCISSAAVLNRSLIRDASRQVGAQSIVAVLDVKKTGIFKKYEVVTLNGCNRTGLDPVQLAVDLQEHGAGEIVINSVDLDGTMCGYDLDLIAKVVENIQIPLTVLGGAGSIDDVSNLWRKAGIVGAGAGSLFVFKGKYRAVLINYPEKEEKRRAVEMSGISL